jgi:hypothetical protein
MRSWRRCSRTSSVRPFAPFNPIPSAGQGLKCAVGWLVGNSAPSTASISNAMDPRGSFMQ